MSHLEIMRSAGKGSTPIAFDFPPDRLCLQGERGVCSNRRLGPTS